MVSKIGFDTAENEPCKICPLVYPDDVNEHPQAEPRRQPSLAHSPASPASASQPRALVHFAGREALRNLGDGQGLVPRCQGWKKRRLERTARANCIANRLELRLESGRNAWLEPPISDFFPPNVGGMFWNAKNGAVVSTEVLKLCEVPLINCTLYFSESEF